MVKNGRESEEVLLSLLSTLLNFDWRDLLHPEPTAWTGKAAAHDLPAARRDSEEQWAGRFQQGMGECGKQFAVARFPTARLTATL